MPFPQIESAHRRRRLLPFLVAAAILLLIFARTAAGYVIDFEWWREMGQLSTWVNTLIYGTVPIIAATIIAFIAFFAAHLAGMKSAGERMGRHPLYAKIIAVALLAVAAITALATMDSWTAVRYFGGRGLAGGAAEWKDPAFGNPLAFYLFEIPFYSMALTMAEAVALLSALIYWLTSRLWHLGSSLPFMWRGGVIDLSTIRWADALSSRFLRICGALYLVFLAIRYALDRYGLLLSEHAFLTGMDYVDSNVVLPLLWVLAATCLIGAAGLLMGRFRWLLLFPAALLLRAVVPGIVAQTYVRPSEVSIERPYIQRHIEATRTAFGLNRKAKEVTFDARPESKIDLAANQPLLDNVRLWDWRAFHAAVTQLQPLRPYVYTSIDADRYTLDGKLRQVLLTPREIDVAALGEAANQWINPAFIYTHGYGLVMAEAKSIEPDGSPVLFIKDAPPVVSVSGLKFTRPEIYYGETVHEPVFVRTAQPEFNYPVGNEVVHTRYSGTGGIPVSSFGMRVAASLAEADWNILLTSYLTPESRMMIRRGITDRLNTLAGFIAWDSDPYLVITDSGRLVWMVDGYMTSDAHPYSKQVPLDGVGNVNYIRNSVKATVDAYDGSAHLYVFDEDDPLLRAYRNLFPALFEPASKMPPDLRQHARYPEQMFRLQAEIYRMYHVRDPEIFYSRSDAWDIAKDTGGDNQAQFVAPNYVVASLPGESKAEFLLMLPFTPRDRENLIGLMMARCDGEHLGEMQFLELPRQQIFYGPRQVEALINQDQNISKDLTLWNQQGSQVLHGQMLVLPVGDTMLYVEPIYIQAAQAKMPQLKKVVIVMGNTLIYRDTYDEALEQLAQQMGEQAPAPEAAPGAPAKAAAPAGPPAGPDPRIAEIRQHLERYRQLVAAGKWSEAGKELEAVQRLVGQ